MTTIHAYKVFTRRLCAPVQGGPSIWDGTVPYQLPRIAVDESDRECGSGWNACARLSTALRIAGLWPDGWPSSAFEVETDEPVVERVDKMRASTWLVTREVPEVEITEAIRELSQAFGDLADEATEQQRLWRVALSRPGRDEEAVIAGLRAALQARGLDWQLTRFSDRRAAMEALEAWEAREAWDARKARKAWTDWATMEALEAWAASAAWEAWAASAARTDLTVWHAARRGWTQQDPALLTTGLRDAYQSGLAIAVPTGTNQLGWVMTEERP